MTETCCCPSDAGSETCERRTEAQMALCPTCQQVGKRVDALTLKALLAVPLTSLRPVEYRFCRTPTCPTVYYSVDGVQCVGEADLRERVYQKHPADEEVFACYCFRYKVGDVRAAVARGQAQPIIAAINAGIQAGQCACDIRNPQGSCCLGNLHAMIQASKAEMGGVSREAV